MSLREELNNYGLLKNCWKSILWNKSLSKREHSKGIDNITIKQFHVDEEKNLLQLLRELSTNIYNVNSLFGFSVKKVNNNTYRLITAPTIKDRIVHKTILCILQVKLHDYINTGVSYCGIGKTIAFIRNEEAINTKKAIMKLIEHVDNKNFWVFKTDIKGFYDNVPKRRLYNIYKKLALTELKDTTLNPLIRDIIFFKLGNRKEILAENKAALPKKYKGISQGSSLSQFFANIYLADFDIKMKNIYGDRIIRYIDDILIVCNSEREANQAKMHTIKYLKNKSLELSEDKTSISDIRKKDFNFLGLNFSTSYIRWKKSKADANTWIIGVLNMNNREYYKDCKTDAERFKKMNQKIQGLGEYLKFYHVKENYELINKQIRHKINSNRKYKAVKYLSTSSINALIPLKKWQSILN